MWLIKITYISVASKKTIIGISKQVLKTGNASSNGRRKVCCGVFLNEEIDPNCNF
jgi:hypothetical protein